MPVYRTDAGSCRCKPECWCHDLGLNKSRKRFSVFCSPIETPRRPPPIPFCSCKLLFGASQQCVLRWCCQFLVLYHCVVVFEGSFFWTKQTSEFVGVVVASGPGVWCLWFCGFWGTCLLFLGQLLASYHGVIFIWESIFGTKHKWWIACFVASGPGVVRLHVSRCLGSCFCFVGQFVASYHGVMFVWEATFGTKPKS